MHCLWDWRLASDAVNRAPRTRKPPPFAVVVGDFVNRYGRRFTFRTSGNFAPGKISTLSAHTLPESLVIVKERCTYAEGGACAPPLALYPSECRSAITTLLREIVQIAKCTEKKVHNYPLARDSADC